MASKPTVKLNSAADVFSDDHTKVVEFSVPGHPEMGSGLLKLIATPGGVLMVGLENVSPQVVIAPPQRKET